jgi:hypothetical protein
MYRRTLPTCRKTLFSTILVSVTLTVGADLYAQSARDAAPFDMTGYWVSVVSEDWRSRMMTPRRGDYEDVPISDAGRRVADTWDVARDEADGNQCRAYGVGAIMRVPGRLHITWEGADMLRIDTDAGMQVRRLHFGDVPDPDDDPTWQGHSVAEWQYAGRGREAGNLKVTTTHFRPGYLRRNGVPYSQDASVTEYYNRITGPDASEWIIVTTVIIDAEFLTGPFITSTHFKKIPDGSGWNPTPCSAR